MDVCSWKAYYWNFVKEFGGECYRTWRGEILASVLMAGFISLINHTGIELRTGLLASGYTLTTFASWHLLRTPWLLQKRASSEGKLPWGWGVLGITFGLGSLILWLYSAAWFYTIQPPVAIPLRVPDSGDVQIVELQKQLFDLGQKVPSEASLKIRASQAADKYEQFFRERATHQPPCIQLPTMTPEEQRVIIEPCAKYNLETMNEYGQRFAHDIMAMVEEFRGKGINVMNIENCAPQGWCGIAISVQLRAFANRLDAKDNVKH